MSETPAPAPAASAHASLGELRARMVLGLAVLAFGVLAVRIGQTASWDLRNYHLYDAWAWLGGRLAIDIAPAQLQTFFNPLLHVPLYLGMQWLHPVAFEFVLGCVQGLNAVLLYAIARRLLPPAIQRDAPWFALAAALVGTTGATQIGELGGTAGDNLVTLPILAGVLLALPGANGVVSQRRWICVGLALGAGLGLKLALAPLVLGLGIAALVVAPGGLPRWRIALAFGGAGFVGVMATGGAWMHTLWRDFGNPFYPLFSSWFDSELAPPFDTRDRRFLPRDVLQAALYPFAWTADWQLTSELRFRDLRVPLLFVAALALPWWRARGAARPHPGTGWLLLGLALGYVGWLLVFGYYRYLAPVEMLAPAVCVILLARALPAWRGLRSASGALLFMMFISTNAPEWGVARHYGTRFLEVELPAAPRTQDAMVLMAGDAPLAYFALGMPDAERFVRVESNFHGGWRPPFGLDGRVADAIDGFRGPLLAVYALETGTPGAEAWSRFGLRVVPETCGAMRSNLMRSHEARIVLCEVERVRPARDALADVVARWRGDCVAPPTDPNLERICRSLERLSTVR